MVFRRGKGNDFIATGTGAAALAPHGRALSPSLPTRLLLSLLFAAATGACAKLRFHLPFTPVPVTGQVFAVLLSGALLGPAFGSLSQLLYIALGAAGVPWFVVGPLGPTGGYLVGFVVAPLVIGGLVSGRAAGTDAPARRPGGLGGGRGVALARLFFAMLAGVAAIYALGAIQFSLYTGKGLAETIPLAVLPFVPFDFAKALFAALAALPFSGRS